MPSENTRVNLTLPPDVVSVLDRLGACTGAGRATIVREWLIEALPALEGFAKAAEMVTNKNIDAFLVMGQVLRDINATGSQLELDIKKSRKAAMRKRIK